MIPFFNLKIRQLFIYLLTVFIKDAIIYVIENVKYKNGILSYELDYKRHNDKNLNKRYYFIFKNNQLYIVANTNEILIEPTFYSMFTSLPSSIWNVDNYIKRNCFSYENYKLDLITTEIERYLSSGFDFRSSPIYSISDMDNAIYRYNNSSKCIMKRSYRFCGCHIELMTNSNNIDDNIVEDLKFTLSLLNSEMPLFNFYIYLNKETENVDYSSLVICSQLKLKTGVDLPKSYVSEFTTDFKMLNPNCYEYLSATDTRFYMETEL